MYFVRRLTLLAFISCVAISCAGGGGGSSSSADAPSSTEEASPELAAATDSDRDSTGQEQPLPPRCQTAHTTGVPHFHGNGQGGCTPGEVIGQSASTQPAAQPAAAPQQATQGGGTVLCKDLAALSHTTGVPHSHGNGHGSCIPEGGTAPPAQAPPPQLPATEVFIDDQVCVGAEGLSSRFLQVIDERFGGADCGVQNQLWEFRTGLFRQQHGDCRMFYLLPQGVDEVTPAQVQTGSSLVGRTGMPIQPHLRIEWTEHFLPGYEFPQGSQKLARFFVARGGHEANVMILDSGRTVQGTVFLFAGDGSKHIVHESVGYIPTPNGIPTGRDLQLSLEVQMPNARQNGVLKFSFDGRTEQVTIPRLRTVADDCLVGFDGAWVGGNWTNQGRRSTRESVRYIDNVRLFAEVR